MMRTLKQRVLSPLVATTVAAACFAVVGIVLGRAITLWVAEAKLLWDATFASEQGDAFSSESRALLATLYASPYPFCSEAETAWFRKLLFQSKYIRDAGRMRDETIDCSATMSRADLPLEQFKPDRSQPDGTLVFGNLPLFRVGNSQGFLLQLGDSYVVYTPHLLENQGAISSHIIYTPTVSSVPRNGQIGSGLSQASAKIFTENGQVRLGDNLDVTRCSARYFRCYTATISVAEAMANDRVYTMSSAALPHTAGDVKAAVRGR
ncbi:MAG: CSS-motif domain-containing protein [Terracidiphilus sp.]|jgi:sensor c-di-GMP phosphodiesterase-like protein